MESKYLLGIPEIDAQHEEISAMVESLKEVIADKDQRHLFHIALKRLHQLLINHFDHEEAFMAMVNYPDLEQHKKNHKGVLKLFDDYFGHPSTPAGHDYLGKLITEKVLGHVMEHDLQMTASVQQYLGKLTTPDLNVPS
jgi:hemerythrin